MKEDPRGRCEAVYGTVIDVDGGRVGVAVIANGRPA
jgi:hypothetical protein